MKQDLPIEKRVFILESKIAELERFRQSLDDRDIALLRRVDDFIDDLRRVERVQMRSFDALAAGQKDLEARLTSKLDEHTEAIDVLVAGQQQIIAPLTACKSQRND